MAPPHRSITPDPPAGGHPEGLEQDGRAARGATVGRYFLLRTLGQGGMGIVYAAFDPELDRKIALKLLREPRQDGRDRARQARLLREAQAMAKVSHPNVVAVHDIGTHGDQVFVAMELVEGGTLTEWIERSPRPVSEIASTFVEAGKGLAAAHAAGLVHRDFKPENVLVGHDGRVRVTDFGLARLDGPSESTRPQPVAGADAKPDEWKKKITQAGAVVGTPLYMSPEQLGGSVPDARSDQYSFCASLYWAIFGTVPEGPFEREIKELKGPSDPTDDGLSQGGVPEDGGAVTFPREPRLPSRLRRTLARGLAWTPEDRYPSMDALLRDLRPEPRALVRRRAAAAAAVALAAAALAVRPWAGGGKERCGGAAQEVSAVWDAAAKAEVQAALGRSGAPGGAGAAGRVTELLDRYAGAWAGARLDVCEAARTWGQESGGVLAARAVCLDRGLHQLRTLVGLLRAADRGVARKAVEAAMDLPPISSCDAAALSAPQALPADPAARAEIAAVQASLDEVRSLYATGGFEPALRQAQAAAARAEAARYWPLQAEALYWQGLLQERTGASRLAEQTLRQALVAADRARSQPDRIRALAKLVFVEGRSLGRFEEAAFFAQLADSELQRFPSDELRFELEVQRGAWLGNQGRIEEAASAYQRALALADRAVGPDHPRKGMLLSNLAGTQEALGRHGEAIALSGDALRIISATRGPRHPSAAYVHYNLARAQLSAGDYPAAHESAQAALRIREEALGPDHPEVADALDVLASVLQADGLYAEALLQSKRALEIKQRTLGPDHLDLCYSLENVGFAELALRAPGRAVAALERAIALRERAGQAPPELVEARFALARALWEAGRDRARARALAASAREGALARHDASVAGAIDGWLASRS